MNEEYKSKEENETNNKNTEDIFLTSSQFQPEISMNIKKEKISIILQLLFLH